MKFILNPAILFVAFAAFILTTQSCTKPQVALSATYRSRSEMLANTWRVSSYKMNGEDITQQVSGYLETYKIDGTYSYTSVNLAGSGTWKFMNNENELLLNVKDSHNPQRLYISLLQEKVLNYNYVDGLDRYELELVSF